MSKNLAAVKMSILLFFVLKSVPEDGGSIYFRNIYIYLQVHKELNPKFQHRQKC
jgi:hypothetical protein